MYDWSCDPCYLKRPSASSMVTRSQSKKLLRVRRPRTEKYKKSLAYHGPKKWNLLPLKMHQTEQKSTFKAMARNWVEKKAKCILDKSDKPKLADNSNNPD